MRCVWRKKNTLSMSLFTRLSDVSAVWLLAFVGGFVDAAGYVKLFGVFTSSITGNLVHTPARFRCCIGTPMILYPASGHVLFVSGSSSDVDSIEFARGCHVPILYLTSFFSRGRVGYALSALSSFQKLFINSTEFA